MLGELLEGGSWTPGWQKKVNVAGVSRLGCEILKMGWRQERTVEDWSRLGWWRCLAGCWRVGTVKDGVSSKGMWRVGVSWAEPEAGVAAGRECR